jgi:glycosyltransferase involved in cell wall biosynthesis
VIPRRIVYVLRTFPKLSETFIAGELAELRRRGIALRILSLLRPTEDLRHEVIGEAGLDELTSYDPASFPAIVNEFQPDLLHAHYATEPTAVAQGLAAEHGCPFTFTAHGYDIHEFPPPDFRERAAAARSVITVSEANAHRIAATFGVPRAHIRVISSGVDTARFRPDPDRPPTDDPPLILCVARHDRVKNLGRLLHACSVIRDRGVGFRCVMVGDGPLRGKLAEAHAQLGLEGLVDMIGAASQREVLNWWRRASIGVLTSDNEGMPVSLMEAAACGVPVVAPAVGGVPELVEDGVTGLLSRPADTMAFAEAVERLLKDPALRRAMGAAARRRAEERFSVTRQVDRLLALWSGLVT